MEELHKNAARVQDALRSAGIEAEVKQLETSARTVAEAASSLGVREAQIAKSLIFMADAQAVMVVASGDEKVDTEALGALMGTKITRANADAVRAATGYPIGGVSPAALPSELKVFVQHSLERFDVVWAAAGTPHAVFPTNYKQLLELTKGTPSAVGI